VLKLVAAERDIEARSRLRLEGHALNPNGEIIFIATPEQPRDMVRRLIVPRKSTRRSSGRIRAAWSTAASAESLAERRANAARA
jgi:hypothetical protein